MRTIPSQIDAPLLVYLACGDRLCFWMVHETPDAEAFLGEIRDLLAPEGHFFIVEPKGHVSAESFATLERQAIAAGFTPCDHPSASAAPSS